MMGPPGLPAGLPSPRTVVPGGAVHASESRRVEHGWADRSHVRARNRVVEPADQPSARDIVRAISVA